MRSEHHAQGRQDCVELPIRVGQCFGVGGFPGQLDTEFAAHFWPASNSSGVKSDAMARAPARAAGIATLPLPAATSSTRSPRLIAAASTARSGQLPFQRASRQDTGLVAGVGA